MSSCHFFKHKTLIFSVNFCIFVFISIFLNLIISNNYLFIDVRMELNELVNSVEQIKESNGPEIMCFLYACIMHINGIHVFRKKK